MKNIIISIIGVIIDLLRRVYYRYRSNKLYKELAYCGEKSNISYPFDIQGADKIEIGSYVSIRHHSVLTAINKRIIIKDRVITATDLVISTGNHQMVPGRFVGSISDIEKGDGYDADVIINEDVWIASRVTILMGVNVGRGAVIAAGAVVNKDVLPYSVVGGVPAKFIKFKWTLREVLEHEEKLYSKEERFSEEQLKSFGLQ